MTIVPGPLGPAVSAELMPRRYNFAADVLERNLRAGRAHKAAYVDPRGSWSFGQLADRAARFGEALRDLGVRREERILLCLFDTIDWPTAFLGAVKAGIIPIPVNTMMTEEDYRFILADSGARTLIVSEAIYAKFENLIKADDSTLRLVIVSGDDARGHHGFEDLIAQATPAAYTAPTTKDDICFWLYTSGSTGRPKGALHVHADLKLTNDLFGAHILALTEEDVCYSAAKLFFAYGLGNALTFPLSAGATTILLPERPSADAVAALLRQHPVTVFYGVPTFYAGFLASAAAPSSSCGSASRPARPCRRRSAGVGGSATGSTSWTGSARPR
jgi:acyl-coenzyme A synthetase/AMP-(fatty) acid ligase